MQQTEALVDARRVLVVTKFRYMGDNIWATPFLRRLHEAAPQARVTLLAGPAIPMLLAGCPYVGDIWPFSPQGPGRLRRTLAMARRIRHERFDYAFLLNRSLESALIARAAGIPRRIGHDTEHRGPLLTTRVVYHPDLPERIGALDLLKSLGVCAEPAPTELWVTDAERAQARGLLAARGIPLGALITGMQVGAHDPYVREWRPERFAAVADRLASTLKTRIVLLGAKEERAVSEQVAEAMRNRPVVLTGETDLRQVLAIISLCRLWVGNDGGLLHASAALGAATVGIFGPTKARACGYSEAGHRTMVVYPDRPARDPETIRRCLDAIEPEAVYDAALEAYREQ